MKIIPGNTYLIEITKILAYMPLDRYTQWASKGPGERFFVKKGSSGGTSISSKNVIVLAQSIVYYDQDKGCL
jgi:hypothetical protein